MGTRKVSAWAGQAVLGRNHPKVPREEELSLPQQSCPVQADEPPAAPSTAQECQQGSVSQQSHLEPREWLVPACCCLGTTAASGCQAGGQWGAGGVWAGADGASGGQQDEISGDGVGARE